MQDTIILNKKNHLIGLISRAIYLVEEAKKNVTGEKSDLLISDLDLCLNNLVGRIKLINNNDFFIKTLSIQTSKRGGFGLSRGFGEILYALPPEPWIDEVMTAVDEIEDYYRKM